MKLTIVKYKTTYSEIGQDLDVRMSFVKLTEDKQYVNAFNFVKCRDFLGDAMDALLNKKKNSIYGFVFDGKKDTFIADKMTLILQIPSKIKFEDIKANVEHFLHLIVS